MSNKGLQVVFGGAAVGPERSFKDEAAVKELFDALEAGNVTTIDTAQLYAGSEELLGKSSAGKRFTIDTKSIGGFTPGHASEEEITKDAEESLEKLKMDKVDIWYIHAPLYETPLSEYLPVFDKLHKRGYFSRFGLSNYKAEDVRKVHSYCKENGLVLPTVYQGNYSAIARLQESVLFPTLRELGISFYAYSPLAGGFLTKTVSQIEGGEGRFEDKSMYHKLYASKSSYIEALKEWESVAEKEGISRAALAYRWVRYNSALNAENGDSIIVGASKISQVKETLKDIDAGPLSEEACKGIDEVWEKIKHEAPLDNVHY